MPRIPRRYYPERKLKPCYLCQRVEVTFLLEFPHKDAYMRGTLCRKCLWVYAHLLMKKHKNTWQWTINHAWWGNAITPDVISIEEHHCSDNCEYGRYLLKPDTHLGRLPRNMAVAVLIPYICHDATVYTSSRFSLGGAVSVLDCTNGARPYTSGTLVVRRRGLCIAHSAIVGSHSFFSLLNRAHAKCSTIVSSTSRANAAPAFG